jgi:hypothetical protein
MTGRLLTFESRTTARKAAGHAHGQRFNDQSHELHRVRAHDQG